MTDITSLEQTTSLLDSTIQVLTGDLATGDLHSGKRMIAQWLKSLRGNDNTSEIANTLSLLQNQIEHDSPDTHEVGQLLVSLADQTRMLSTQVGPEGEVATQLEVLSQALRTAAGQVV